MGHSTLRADLEEAAAYARRAVAVNPRLAEARLWLGYALFRLAEHSAAQAQLDEARLLQPNWSLPAYFAGCTALDARQLGPALAHFQRAVTLEKTGAMQWIGLGWSHLELGHGPEALYSFQQAVDLDARGGLGPAPGAGAFLAECLRRAGAIVRARESCAESLDRIERSDHVYRDTFRGVCLVTLGRIALAARDRAGATAAFPRFIGA